jgi:hypothetical protein
MHFLVLLLNTLSATPLADRNFIANGGFEDYAAVYCKQNWCGFNDKEAKAIAPWYVPTVIKDYEVDGSVWPAKEGHWSVDLNPNAPGTIAQDVDLNPGKQYTLSFWLNSNACGTTNNRTGTVAITGQPITNFWHISQSPWKQVVIPFTATQAKTTIAVSGTNAGSCGPVVDNFVLKRVMKCSA